MDEDLIFQVLAIVSEIPWGKVASYKQKIGRASCRERV